MSAMRLYGRWGTIVIAGRFYPFREWEIFVVTSSTAIKGLKCWNGSAEYNYGMAAKFILRKLPVKAMFVVDTEDEDHVWTGKLFVTKLITGDYTTMYFTGTGALLADEARRPLRRSPKKAKEVEHEVG